MNFKFILIQTLQILILFLFASANGAVLFGDDDLDEGDGDGTTVSMSNIFLMLVPIIPMLLPMIARKNQTPQHKGRPRGYKTIKRKRRSAEHIFSEMSDYTFRRTYRMNRQSFWKLLNIIECHLPRYN